MLAAAYIRVSSAQQSARLQREAIRRACNVRGDRIGPGGWFEDKQSGRTLERPGLQNLRGAVRAGKVRRLYVWRLDRLTRSGIRDTLAIVEEFRHAGCELVTVSDGFDLGGPGAEVVLAVLAWAAQMERAAIGARITAARARIEAEGGRWGRPRAIDPTDLEQARRLAKRGHSVRSIAAELGLKRSTLGDALAGRGHYGQ